MQQINLQVYPRGVNPIIQVSQYDKGRLLQLNLYDGAEKYNIPADSEVLFEGQKPDGMIFSYKASYENNVVSISIAQQATLIPGRTTCELRILNGDSVNIGTIDFTMYVESSPVNGDYPVSETDIPAIIELGQQYAQRAEDAAERAEADAALADEAAEIAQNVLDSIPEDYETLSEDVEILKSDVTELKRICDFGETQESATLNIVNDAFAWSSGLYQTGISQRKCTDPVPVVSGKKIYISTLVENDTFPLAVFYNDVSQSTSSGLVSVVVDDSSQSSHTVTEFEVVVPSTATYVRINGYSSSASIALKDTVTMTYSESIDEVTDNIMSDVNALIEQTVGNIDKTLTVEDVPADAKAVGDRLSNLENLCDFGVVKDPQTFNTNADAIAWSSGLYQTGISQRQCTDPVSVTESEKIYVSTCIENASFPLAVFYNNASQSTSSGLVSVVVDDSSQLSHEVTDFEITVPSGATYVRINRYGSTGNIIIKKDKLLKYSESITVISERLLIDAVTFSKLKNKTVVWFGTSIPAGGAVGNYPQILSQRLGFTVYNEAVGSSACRAGCHAKITVDDPMGWTGTAFANIAYALSGTLAEKEEIIENYADYGWSVTLDDAHKNYIRNCSYERKLDKYLSGGSIGQVDVYVFDHGFNDALFHYDTYDELETIPSNPYDRTYFIGAMNFLINRILEDNPKAKIIFIEHYQTDWSASAHVVPAQKILAEYWNFPSVPTWKKIGWTQKQVLSKGKWVDGYWVNDYYDTPVSYSLKNIWMADDLHPHSDLSGKALQHYANILEPYFKEFSTNE